MKIWIDPPSGWRYGFPKVWDPEVDDQDIRAWIIREGYPQAEIDRLGDQFSWRSWEDRDQPREFRQGIPTKSG